VVAAEAQLGQGVTDRARRVLGSGGGRWSSGPSESREELGDGGRVRDDGANDAPTAASDANAKLCIEGTLQQGSPVDACGRCVQLALENALAVRAAIERTLGATCSALPVVVSDEVTTASTASRRKTARPSPAGGGGAPRGSAGVFFPAPSSGVVTRHAFAGDGG
jgi:hypothetical protein